MKSYQGFESRWMSIEKKIYLDSPHYFPKSPLINKLEKKTITISSKNAVLDLLCFINLAK